MRLRSKTSKPQNPKTPRYKSERDWVKESIILKIISLNVAQSDVQKKWTWNRGSVQSDRELKHKVYSYLKVV